MKRPIKITLYVVLAILCAAVGTHYYLLDGLDGFIWSRLFQEDTRYSERYSDAAFRKVYPGVTQTTLTELLGQPLRTYSPTSDRDMTILWFSESPNDSHFRLRSVDLRDGLVIRRHSEFYVD